MLIFHWIDTKILIFIKTDLPQSAAIVSSVIQVGKWLFSGCNTIDL